MKRRKNPESCWRVETAASDFFRATSLSVLESFAVAGQPLSLTHGVRTLDRCFFQSSENWAALLVEEGTEHTCTFSSRAQT